MVMVKLLHKQSLLQYSEPSLKITGGKCPPCAILRGPAVGKEGEPAAPCPSSSRYKTVPPRWSGGQLVHRPPTWSLLTAQVKIVNIYFYLNIVLTFWPHPHKTTIFNHLEHKSLPQSRLGGGHPSGYLEEEFCSLLPSIFRARPQEPLTVLHICFEKRRPSWKTMGPVLNAVQNHKLM